MIVAFHHPHNEGLVAGLIDGPGFDTDLALVDTFEVDARIRSFATEQEGWDWLREQNGGRAILYDRVSGGFLHQGDGEEGEDG